MLVSGIIIRYKKTVRKFLGLISTDSILSLSFILSKHKELCIDYSVDMFKQRRSADFFYSRCCPQEQFRHYNYTFLM